MGTLDNEFVKFGRTVAEVMKHYGSAPDMELNANIGFVLLDKEERKGLQSFSQAERFVYAAQAMSREVNNGGWSQFFFNSSGYLAFDLVPALEAMGSTENLSIARRALQRFGKPKSLTDEDRAKHLEKLTKDGKQNPWDDLEAMTLKFIAKSPGEFSP